MTAETPPLTDPEAGLARLRERLDRAQQEAGAVPFAALPSAGRPNGWRRLSYALAAAVVVEAVGLTLFSYGQLTQDERAAPYQTLSAAPAPAPAAAIRLLPDPQMRVGDLQRQLRTLELQIVSGPNAAGAYALAPLSADTPLDERIARLRATPGMLLVEAIALPATGSAR